MKISVYKNFADIPENLVRECSYSNQPDFLSCIDWYKCLFETSMSPDERLQAYFVTDSDGQLIASLFCVRKNKSRELRSLTNFYSTSYGPAARCDSTREDEAWRLLATYIARERPSWTSLNFRMLLLNDSSRHPLFKGLAVAGFFTYQYKIYENWYARTEGLSFERYYEQLTSRLRNTIRRKDKKLANEYDVRVEIIQSSEDRVESSIDDYIKVYNSSWKKPEPYPAFIPRLVKECARLGTLVLGVLYVNDRPAAAQLWIVTPAKALIYKLAYDEEFSKHSPGSILSKALFEKVMDEYKPAEIDYGIGGEAYKRDWMNQCRSVYALHGYNTNTLTGLLSAGAHKLKSGLKRLGQFFPSKSET